MSAGIVSLDMVGSLKKSAKHLILKTLDQVNTVAGQGGVVENVGAAGQNLIKNTKKAVDSAI